MTGRLDAAPFGPYTRKVMRLTPGLLAATVFLGVPARAELDPESRRFLAEVRDDESVRLAPVRRSPRPVDEERVRRWVGGGAAAVPELVRVLGSSEDGGERSDAVHALAALGRDAVPPLLALLDPPHPKPWAASRALVSLGTVTVPVLLAGLPARPPLVRGRTAEVLGEVRPVRPEAVEALERMAAEDPDWEARLEAVRALRRVGPEALSAVPTLVRLLGDPRWSVESARALAAAGGEPRLAAEVLLAELRRPGEGWGQVQVVEALGLTAARVPEALDGLVEALRCSPFVAVRAASARALGRLGPAARAAVVPLVMAGDDEGRDIDTDREVRRESEWALARIGAPAAEDVPGLTVLLGHRESRVRLGAAQALGRAGPAARAAVPALAARILEEGAWGGAFAESVGLIGEAGPEVVAILEQATKVREPVRWNVAEQAAFALNALGQGREASLAYFRRLFNSTRHSDEIKVPAAEGLRQLGEEEPRVLRFLSDLVRETAVSGDEPWVAQRATDVLARYGAKAERAVPAIERWLAIGSDRYRDSGLAALEAIGTPAARAALAKFGPARGEAPAKLPDPLPRRVEPTPVERLVYALRNAPAAAERARSARELGLLGASARPAVFALVLAAGDEPEVAAAGAEALERIGAPEPETVRGLSLLLYGDPGVVIEAIKVLGRIGPPAKGAVGGLAYRVSPTSDDEACPAADALARIGAPTDAALKALKEALRPVSFGPPDLPGCAARALLALGREREAVRAHYAGLLGYDAFLLKLEGAEGLVRLGEAGAAAAALAEAVAQAEPSTALAAAALMGRAGPDGDAVVPALERRLAREPALYSPAVGEALRSVGTPRALALLRRYAP